MKRLFGLASVAIFSLSVAHVASANIGTATKAVNNASNTTKIGTVSKISKADASKILASGVALSNTQAIQVLGANGQSSVAASINGASFLKSDAQKGAFLRATARGVMKSSEVVTCLQGIANEKNASDRQLAFDRLAKIVVTGADELVRMGDTVSSANASELLEVAGSMKDTYARELNLSADVATQEYNSLVTKCSIDGKLSI